MIGSPAFAKYKYILALGLLTLVSLGVVYLRLVNPKPGPTPSPNATITPSQEPQKKEDVTIVAQNLTIPWDIAFLPSGEMLVTERNGNLLQIAQDKTIIKIAGVKILGEGGLLGIALDPDFVRNSYIYLYMTTTANGKNVNEINRYTLVNKAVTDKKTLLTGIPASSNHDGGQLTFSPDGKLYATTGDAEEPNNAQDLKSLSGKILRLNADGSIPSDNPFPDSYIYSYGHRNPQGLVWDNDGTLWATEHGRSGILSGYDELNKIQSGKNYGWPIIEGTETKSGMVTPVINSGSNATWAPSGIAYYKDTLFFAGLRGEALYSASLPNMTLKTSFLKQFGRLRAVVLGPDGYLYVSTSNKDGRGNPNSTDDKIIRVNPDSLL